ncbi:hypothetical protein ROHU_000447 [Labeo rohita]|uniref:Uncharacterized protein n=1 Tax=Labeo rohita TaxID=84645 RepID=A0A498P3C9_LABRO|nr:hypothetical protein ROHU_000447 [Labeo rohita]
MDPSLDADHPTGSATMLDFALGLDQKLAFGNMLVCKAVIGSAMQKKNQRKPWSDVGEKQFGRNLEIA